jgi:hypothetical protein
VDLHVVPPLGPSEDSQEVAVQLVTGAQEIPSLLDAAGDLDQLVRVDLSKFLHTPVKGRKNVWLRLGSTEEKT